MNFQTFSSKTSLSLLLCTALFGATQQAQATLLDIAQSPLILSESVAPNLILTLDDSGSMRWAFVPDDLSGTHATRRAKAAYFNPMYYNPAVTYTVPVKINADGSRASTQYSTSFTAAYTNGFNTGLGSVDLSTNYKVNWTYIPTGGQPTTYGYNSTNARLATNPAADFGPLTISTTTADSPTTTTNISGKPTSTVANNRSFTGTTNGYAYQVTRTGTSTCTLAITTATTSTGAANTTQNTPSQGYTTTQQGTTYNSYSNLACSRSGTSSGTGTFTISATASTYTTTTTTVKRNDLTQAGVPAYYYLYDTTVTGCSSVKTDDNCYRLVNVTASSGQVRPDDSAAGQDERLNFAIWYTFYRNRALATLSAANLAFNGLPTSVRLTWQNLETCTTLNGTSCGPNLFRKFAGAHRGNYFSWLSSVTFNSGTPLRGAMVRAGEFLKSSTAWAYDPNPFTANGGNGTTVQSPEYACRPSYQIMMTDGMWNTGNGNEARTPSETLKPDQTNTTLPDSKSYGGQHPFADAQSDTLADLAFHYWATDARTTLDNDVKPIIVAPNSSDATAEYWDPRNDPATWQHMVTYTIGLGLGSALNNTSIPWTGDTFGGAGYNALKAGTVSWPAASANSDNNVYDLWHAAINSRGEFFSADSPDKIVEAFRTIINRISNRTTSASAPGVSASVVQDTLTREVYETQFNSEDWTGNLIKYTIDADGVRSQSWDTRALNNVSAASRNIKMYSSGTGHLQDFTWGNLSTAQQTLLNRDYDTTNSAADTKGQSRVNYLRGDRSNEGTASGQFRERNGLLGDIINSSPALVGTPKLLAYYADAIDGGTNADGSSKYAAFRTAHSAEGSDPARTPMVYVGANDGMLHGFDATTGTEKFAYVPSAVIQNLYKLSAQKYKGTAHQYYVDGTPVVSDVYFDNAWHTVLVGTLRAGGRSMFALDITDPDAITLLWEKSFDSGDPYVNMGYSFPQPTIARLHTGKWAVVTGNGYGNQAASGADKASLMILDVQTGAMVKELLVTGDATRANGLSTPRLADNNSDGVADYAYAGDLQGNLWRFDLFPSSARDSTEADPFRRASTGTTGGITDSAAAANDFAVSYGGKPLYTAIDNRSSGATSQTIMAPPSLVRHPTSLGYLIIFGTGKYFETSDGNVDSSRAQSIYGIWDRKTKAQSTSARTTALARTDLISQSITEEPASNPFGNNPNVNDIRLISQNAIQWYSDGATDTNDTSVENWGWVLDLKIDGSSTLSGEMMINPMASRGSTLLVNTLTPNADPCKEGVDSWLYGLDPYTGGRTKYNVFDLNNNGTINDGDSFSDSVVSGYKKAGAGGFATNNGEIFTAPGIGGGVMYSPGPNNNGRQSWRVLPEEARE